MSRQYVFLFVIALLMVGFGAYKVGDYYGFDAGQKHGYGLECREDLEKLKKVVYEQQEALRKTEGMLRDYSRVRDSLALQKKVQDYNRRQDYLRELFATNKPKTKVDREILKNRAVSDVCHSTMRADGSIVWDDMNCLDCFIRVGGVVQGKDCGHYYGKK